MVHSLHEATNTPPFLFALFFLLCCTCACNLASARKQVDHLPGFDGPLPFALETGYVEVDEKKGAMLFYYFIESERNAKEDPLMLWLTGGPGCSGFSGLVFEIGPLSFDLQGYIDGLPSLFYRHDSWTQASNIIFVDSPVGSGFSYSLTPDGIQTSDTETVHRLQIFLYKWLEEHSQFKSNALYIGGDSYSGMIIPALAFEIATARESYGALFNLKGYLAGNPLTDENFDEDAKVPFAHGMALISDELYESTKKSCSGTYVNPSDIYCAKHLDVVCEESGYLLSEFWANNDTVREALGIHKGTVVQWNQCTKLLHYTSDIRSAVSYHLNVTKQGYLALIYSGDHDLVVPYIGTQAWIRSLNFSIVDDWRPWYVDGQVAGFTRRYSNNLTFVTVKGAGHTAPEYKPKECLNMIKRWLSGARL